MSYVKELRKYVGHMPLQLPGAVVIVWRKNKNDEVEIFLQLREDHNNIGILGGGIEFNETYEECALRELEEESGLKAKKNSLQLLNVYAGPKHVTVHPNLDIVHHTIVTYRLDYNECILSTTAISSETKALKWLTLGEIKSLLEEGEEKNFFHCHIPIFWDMINKYFL